MSTTSPSCTLARDFTFHPGAGLAGRDVYRDLCTCGITVRGYTHDQAQADFDRHQTIPAPPADVLTRPITKQDISAYPDYFISGPGRAIAGQTDCGHGYYLTDSCPCCP